MNRETALRCVMKSRIISKGGFVCQHFFGIESNAGKNGLLLIYRNKSANPKMLTCGGK